MKAVPFLCATILALAVGCGESPGRGAAAPKPEGEGFKVALLTPGPVSDAGWSAMAYHGLQAIEKDCGATINNQQATDSQIKDAMRAYAQKGY